MGDHTEAIQVEYDPTITSYQALLDFFWSHHDPTSPEACSRQYMSAIFYHTEIQRCEAELSLIERRRKGAVSTQILPYTGLHVAEDYHQKYLLQQEGWIMEQLGLEPSQELIESIQAARLNGYVAGFGDLARYEAELPSLSLPPKVAEFVRKKIGEKGKRN